MAFDEAQMWPEFEKLRSAWSLRRESGGGTAALAGFGYQFTVSLLKLLRSSQGEREPRLFLEALSDLASLEGGCLVVTQVKLTLRSVTKSLDELWLIDRIAEESAPALTPHLRFAILTSNNLIREVGAAFERWEPAGAHDRDRLKAFRDKVSIRVDPDPENELALYLVNAFGEPEPFSRIREWMGRLLLNPSPSGLEAACRAILIDFRAIEAAAREQAHRFHIWSWEDHPPAEIRLETDPRKAVLTGQIPSRLDLADGRFAPRSVYASLHHGVELWATHNDGDDSQRLRAFWISGRSGTGKSVALLHLLSSLHANDDRRIIIWLGPQADRLPEAVRWARHFIAEGREVFMAADDPFTPERHHRVAAAVADALRECDSACQAYPGMRWPVLLFCGPTEQFHDFRDDLTDYTTVEEFSLHHETLGDIDELRRWYEQRTGRAVLPVGDVEDTLIVQLFFEWATGQPIREFARRLRERVEGLPRSGERTVFEIAAEILALNRIYSLFPAQAVMEELELDPKLGSSFDMLKDQERHFSFEPKLNGYRLTHPHLANALYCTWFGRDAQRRERKSHLRTGIMASLRYGRSVTEQFAPLWAIARAASGKLHHHAEMADRLVLIAVELRELLSELYAQEFVTTGSPLTHLPVWVDLDRCLDLQLSPSPLDLMASAVAAAATPAAGLRLACHKLLEHRGLRDDATELVASTLHRFPSWHEWGALALNYTALVGPQDLVEPLCSFAADHWDRPIAHAITNACFRHSDQPAAQTVVLAWLRKAEATHPAWSWILASAMDKFGIEPFRAVAWRFVTHHRDMAGWAHIWYRLHSSEEGWSEVRAVGHDWLKSAPETSSGWDRVWQSLWHASEPRDGELLKRAFSWLDQAPPEHQGWAYVWEELWSAPDADRRALAPRGRRWLDEVPEDHGSWAFVWEKLVAKAGPEIGELLTRGRSWLDGTSADHGSWPYVWRELWERGEGREDLALRGRTWLEEASPAHPGWAFLWLEILPFIDATLEKELYAQARLWLDEVSPDQSGWARVWEVLWSQGASEELYRLGQRWLKWTSPDNSSWGWIWTVLWNASGRDDPDLRALGWSWLEATNVENGNWNRVWEALWHAGGRQDQALRAMAVSWLASAPADQGGWARIWVELWDREPVADEALARRGREWLDEAPPGHHGWVYVWNKLWTASGSADPDLLARGRRWLDEVPPEHGSWVYLWRELWKGANLPDLKDRGSLWLEEANPNNPSWPFLWRDLFRSQVGKPGELEFVQLGMQWLETDKLTNKPWPVVWMILWSHPLGEPDRLARVAEVLLDQAPPKHPAQILQRLALHGSTPPKRSIH